MQRYLRIFAQEGLGRPDRSTDFREMDVPDALASDSPPEKRQRSVHQYTNRWKTLDVHVIEYDDDSISYAISGKRKPVQRVRMPWWLRGYTPCGPIHVVGCALAFLLLFAALLLSLYLR